MNESNLLESAVSEYRSLISDRVETNGQMNIQTLIADLSEEHNWTWSGADAIVRLASEYGAFMLRNALALAVVLEKEDGSLGF